MTRTPDTGADRGAVPWLRRAKTVFAVSAVYVWAYFLTALLVMPLQQAAFPTTVMCFLFLPHGVRVLSTWLYDWRSVPMLLPGALLCNLHFAGERAFDADILFGTAASLIAAPLAFALGRVIGGPGSLSVGRLRVPLLMAVGTAASVFNLIALRLIYGLSHQEGSVILVGDVAGLAASLLILWLGLKLLPARV